MERARETAARKQKLQKRRGKEMLPGKYTQRAKFILNYAKDEAKRLKHDRVDTEHLFLGLVHEGQGHMHYPMAPADRQTFHPQHKG